MLPKDNKSVLRTNLSFFSFPRPPPHPRQRIIWSGPREMIHWTKISQDPSFFWVALPFLVALFHIHTWVWVTDLLVFHTQEAKSGCGRHGSLSFPIQYAEDSQKATFQCNQSPEMCHMTRYNSICSLCTYFWSPCLITKY